MSDELTSASHWAFFSDEPHYYGEVGSAPRKAGSPVPGMYFLPPEAAAILVADQFWNEVNSELGTFLDYAEEEELSPDLSARIAQKIWALARSRYRQGLIRKEVAWRADGGPIWAEIEASVLAELLVGLADFLMDASKQGKVIIASL